MTNRRLRISIATVLLCCCAARLRAAPDAAQILTETGVKGGLVVHLGCGDGALTVALLASERYLVHGLDTDPQHIRQTRARIRELGLEGKVTADTFDGRSLPFIDNVVNLVVAEGLGDVPMAEVMRVLVPNGVAYVGGKMTVKPRPKAIDEWTHYLHDASNNAVAQDEAIGPPRHLQWQCGPRWSRHHDHMASVSALVSAAGRVFYILDGGSHVSPQLPSDWQLVARDAFNGVLLWKRPIARWHDRLWPLKSGPASLPRRLVAVGNVVYATLGIDAPVTALDAATGKALRTYAGTKGAEEILHQDGVLLVLINRTPVDVQADLAADAEEGKSRDRRTTYSEKMKHIWAGIRSPRWANGDRSILAFDGANGKALWRTDSRVIPLTLAADRVNVYFHDGEKIVALSRSTGTRAWAGEPVPVWQGLQGQGLQSWFAPTLVAQDGKVLFAGGEKMHMSYMGWGSKTIGQDTMTAFDAATGKKLWTAPHPYSGYSSPEDLFVIDGKAWTGVTAKGGPKGRYSGRDIRTGEAAADFPATLKTFWFHHRCHRAKATSKYILSSRTGIEFVDLTTGEWTINHWVRGGCLYGIMPANGLIYAPPHPCACYPEAKLYGFVALGAQRSEIRGQRSDRLERGAAYAAVISDQSSVTNGRTPQLITDDRSLTTDDWPTYRHDPARSGVTSSAISPALRQVWKAELGGRLTQPITGGGMVFAADAERHVVHALDADTGSRQWTYHAGGSVDSSPTYHAGRVLFGSADGYVYCLRATDGELVWRFHAAPIDRRMVAFEGVESVWPVNGSVLVQKGIASFVAGRSMYIDGGLRVGRLDVATGRLLGEKVLGDRDPESDGNLQVHVRGLNMPVALPDILSSDGEHLFMRSQVMDLEGKRLKLGPAGSGRPHLFAPYGFTDDSWFHRTYWVFGDSFRGGVGGFGSGKKSPAGRILVCGDSTIFGYGRKPQYYRWGSAIDYHLYAAAKPSSSGSEDGDGAQPNGLAFGRTSSLNPAGKPITIAAWVRPDAPDGTILVRGANIFGFALILTDRKPRMLLRMKGKTHSVVSSEAIGSVWTHLAGVLHEDGRMEVYANGKICGSTKGVPLINGNPAIAMKVGHDDTHQLLPEPLAPFSGALDEVRLYHRTLSSDEIAQLATRPSKAGLVLHLSFAGRVGHDQSPHDNHGRASGKLQTVDGPVGKALFLKQPAQLAKPSARAKRRKRKGRSAVNFLWTRDVPIMVRAMALAGDKLLIAGPPDVLDEDAAFQSYADEATQKQLLVQDAALRGRSGAICQIIDANTGKTLAELRLDSPPVFDGLIAAAGHLFLSTTDGRVMCYGKP